MQDNERDSQSPTTSALRSEDGIADTTNKSGPLTDLTAFQRDALRVVEEGPKIGLEIKRILEDYYKKEVHHGRLYPNLDSLTDKGLIQKEQIDGRSNEYTILHRGKREINAHRNFWNHPLEYGEEDVDGDVDESEDSE